MSWREKLKLDTIIKDNNVAMYLKRLGFQEELFTPTFHNKEAEMHQAETLGRECLKLWKKEEDGSTYVVIYINEREAYVERYFNVLKSSKLVKIEEPLTMETVDNYLDQLI